MATLPHTIDDFGNNLIMSGESQRHSLMPPGLVWGSGSVNFVSDSIWLFIATNNRASSNIEIHTHLLTVIAIVPDAVMPLCFYR